MTGFWLVVLGASVPAADAVAGLIPAVDTPTARKAAGDLSVDGLKFSGRGNEGLVELEEAVRLFREGNIDQSLARLVMARKANDRLPPPSVMLARMFLADGGIAPGRRLLEQAAVEHAGAADVYLALGDLAMAEGRLADASLQYEKARSLAGDPSAIPDSRAVGARSGLAAVAERRHQWAEAERLLIVCLELQHENGLFRQRLARVLFEQQRYDEAAESLMEAQCLDPHLESAALAMARWHHAAGHRLEAEQMMKAALTQAPDDPATLVAAALWNLEVDRPAEAHSHIAHLAEVQPDAPGLLRLQGIVAAFLDDLELAEQCFQALVTDNPGDFAASNQLALVLVEQESEGKHRRAIQLAEINVRQFRESPEAQATLGWVLYRLGRLDEAERIYQPLISAGHLSPDAAYYVGRLLVDRGRSKEARSLLTAALESPGNFYNRKSCHLLLNSLAHGSSASQ